MESSSSFKSGACPESFTEKVMNDYIPKIKEISSSKPLKLILHSIAFGTTTNFFGEKPVTERQMNMTIHVMSNSLLYWTQKLFKENFHSLIRYKNAEVGFHQLRIKCGKDFVGYPVPEGWHKDGFDYVILVNFGSKNIKGGVTRIKEKIDQSNDTFSAFLKKGEYLFRY